MQNENDSNATREKNDKRNKELSETGNRYVSVLPHKLRAQWTCGDT
jgi:hypothetical protein